MKAKDLTGRNIEDIEELGVEAGSEESKHDDDQVAAAYENISKKLSSLRGGGSGGDRDEEKEADSDKSEEIELEEWKGPKPPVKEELRPQVEEEDEDDIRKVKLKNLENDKEDDESDEEEETAFMKKGKEDEPEEDEADDNEMKPKEWKPAENDPLDEELDEAEIKQSNKAEAVEEMEKEEELVADTEENPSLKEEEVDSEIEERSIKDQGEVEKAESVHSEISSKPEEDEMEADLAPKAGPDSLDDLADETPFAPDSDIPRKAAVDSREEEEYSIPNLKVSRQEGSSMGYNAPSQREGVGQSYSPKNNNMDGNNDPNSFFSQHQPQPAKRANKFHLLVLVIIGIVVIGFTVYILKGGFGDIKIGTTQPSPSPSAVATPEPTPTPTPEPEVDRGAFTVRVLNGTSTSGLAGKVRDKLKETGYKTSTPGNATETDVAQTEIRVKEGSESAALVQRLILDLAPDYEAKEGEKLDDKVAYDAEVIIGDK